jgi:signal transduction histidine kinase/HPt (histidine-containing phosphotransfer) domain-containing protein
MRGNLEPRLPINERSEVVASINQAINITAEEIARQRRGEVEALSAAARVERGLRYANADLKRSQRLLATKNAKLMRAIERATELAAEAEVANAAKGAFIATISHELRTPLNRVVGSLELLTDAELDAEHRELLDTARDGAKQLRRRVTQALAFVSRGEVERASVSFDLRRIVAETIEGHAALARNGGAVLTGAVDDSVPSHIQGNPAALSRILRELVRNAVEHSGGAGVHVEATTTEGTPDALQVTVADTGCGLPAAVVATFAAPDPSRDDEPTDGGIGAGVGLTIVRRLVASVDGTLRVVSEPGAGSRFEIEVPLCAPEVETGIPTSLDTRELLERLGGDEKCLDEVLAVFLVEAPRQLRAVLDAAKSGDALAVRQRAHTLKGSAAAIGAEALRVTAERVERWASKGRVDGEHELLAELEGNVAESCMEVERACRRV